VTGEQHAAMTSPQRRGAATAWVLYDLANTIYAATLTFLFTPWITAELGERTSLGRTQTISMVLAALLVTACGAITDRTARTRTYLTVVTLCCIGAMWGWTVADESFWLLTCFFVANVTYNLGLLFYNALLPSVARPERAGMLSGIGVGVGYLGTILVVAVLVLALGDEPVETRLRYAALGFLLFALPCLVLVKDRRAPQQSSGPTVRNAMSSLCRTLQTLPRQRALLCFLLANFCLVDVLNTAVLFFADFTKSMFASQALAGSLALFGYHYPTDGIDSYVAHMGLSLNVLALVFGIGLGMWTDRFPLGVLRLAAAALLLALIGAVQFGGASATGYMLSLVCLGAFGLAGIWTAGRKVLLRLAPPDRIGEYFGLYGITLKLSVVGSYVYGKMADLVSIDAALLVQAVPLCLGLVLLALVQLPPERHAADS
jgi:UMF1 family MFS transporter